MLILGADPIGGAAGAGLLALLVATARAVYKPRGMTPNRWRKQYEERTESPAKDAALRAG